MGNSNTERVSARLDASLALILDEQARAATTAWVAAWDDVSNELLTALDELTATGVKPTRSQIMRSARLRNALLLIEDRLAGAFDTSAGRTIADLHRIVEQAGVGADLLVSTLLPADMKVRSWTRVDPRQVDAIVARSTKQITARSLPLAPEATRVMKRELVRGLLVGENPRETARRMVRRTEGTFNGGLARALTIARTETLDAHRAASMLGYRQNADVLEGWEWHADLSSRTCSACWAMHGTIHPLDEPGPAGHQNCRCTGLPVLKDPAELGFETPDPVSIIPDAEARFNALSPAEQLDVLGPSRFAAWKAGEFPMSAWAQKRTTDGWRDSWVPAKAPAGFKGTTRAQALAGNGGAGGANAGGLLAASSPPPIGKVLNDGAGNLYHLPGPVYLRAMTAGDHFFPYIPIAAHRATAMLQYDFETEKMSKAAARNIAQGKPPLAGIPESDDYAAFSRVLTSNHMLAGYSTDDLKLDVIAAGYFLEHLPVTNIGTVYRGMAFQDSAENVLSRFPRGAVESWRYASATADRKYATHHAQNFGMETVVVWKIVHAHGRTLESVGRMTGVDERVLDGRIRILNSKIRNDGIVEVLAQWLTD